MKKLNKEQLLKSGHEKKFEYLAILKQKKVLLDQTTSKEEN